GSAGPSAPVFAAQPSTTGPAPRRAAGTPTGVVQRAARPAARRTAASPRPPGPGEPAPLVSDTRVTPTPPAPVAPPAPLPPPARTGGRPPTAARRAVAGPTPPTPAAGPIQRRGGGGRLPRGEGPRVAPTPAPEAAPDPAPDPEVPGGGGATARTPSAALAATPDGTRREDAPTPDGDAILRGLERRHMDALAHRLIGPLGRLLRSEMRLGRERAGRLLDGGR
ncbi:hypothetical protein ABGB06_26640, partial [Streptomyces sp. B6B3]